MGPASHDNLHTFSLVTRDRPGVLVRIALAFSRRGYNIESLAVSPGLTEGFARMTIVSRGDPGNAEQIARQLAKLIDVVFVTDHKLEEPVEAEVALAKLCCGGELRHRVLAIAKQHGASVTADGVERVILTMHGTSSQITAFLGELWPCNVEEMVRSGKIIVDRGPSRFAHLLGRE